MCQFSLLGLITEEERQIFGSIAICHFNYGSSLETACLCSSGRSHAKMLKAQVKGGILIRLHPQTLSLLLQLAPKRESFEV